MKKKVIRSHALYHLIRILLPVKKPGLMIEEIMALTPSEYQNLMPKCVQNAVGRGLCEGSPPAPNKPKTSYYLTPVALKKYQDFDQFKVDEVVRGFLQAEKKAGKKPKKMMPTPRSVPAKIEPESPPNISLEALSLTDQISQVIGQNAQYREVLASIHKLIGDLLNPPTKQPAIEEE